MRILVKCQDCHRRYDASRRAVGSRFRCHCGQVLTVHQPRSHEATVVRCSSCGGPRQHEARACVFCGADFTIHERDLSTVCPDCLARVSDRARYCPQCSVPLGGESIHAEDTAYACPVCAGDHRLSHRLLGKERASVLECTCCAGFWMSVDSFLLLRDRVIRRSAVGPGSRKRQPPAATVRKQSGPLYRHCIECGRMMARRQYVRGCGIIIDVCRDHGIWFDADELQQTLRWHEEGGRHCGFLDKVRAEQQESQQVPPPVQAIIGGENDAPQSSGGRPDFLLDLFEGLVADVSRLFR